MTAALPPTQPVAAVIKYNQPQLVVALNEAAQSNSTVRNQIEKLSGSGSIALAGLGVVVASMAMQTLQIMRDPDLRQQMAERTRADLVEYANQIGIKTLETDARTDTGTDTATQETSS
jgi:hypothetical protein